MDFLPIVLIVVSVWIVVFVAWKLWRKNDEKELFEKPGLRELAKSRLPLFRSRIQEVNQERPYRMMVAIRRYPESRAHFIELNREEQQRMLEKIKLQLESLYTDWEGYAHYRFGFHGSTFGLSSDKDEPWILFTHYDVRDYQDFRKCQTLLESNKYLYLRTHCDIKILFGDEMVKISRHVNELF